MFPEDIDQFMSRVLAVIPTAEFGEDNDGQIIIYTNLHEVDHGSIVGRVVQEF